MATILRLADEFDFKFDKDVANLLEFCLMGRKYTGFPYTIQERREIFKSFRNFLIKNDLPLLFSSWMKFLTR